MYYCSKVAIDAKSAQLDNCVSVQPHIAAMLDTRSYKMVDRSAYDCQPLDNGSGLHTCTLRGGGKDAKPLHVPAGTGDQEMFVKFGGAVSCDASWCSRKIETSDGKCYCGDGQMGKVVDDLSLAGNVAGEACMSDPSESCYKVTKATADEYEQATSSDAARGLI